MLRTRPSLLSQDPLFRVLDDLLSAPLRAPATASDRGPRTNAYQTETGWQLVLEVPGLAADALEVTVDDGDLVVTAQAPAATATPEGARPLRTERRAPRGFQRRFSLPTEADLDQTTASLDSGLLTLSIPRVAPARKRIPVQHG